ncbi:lysozyme inhibitor LprI family protein [Flavobacterium sp.]|uniref:lysozyme inhibitor LprI family protein n=1 Tax=Flavobacterium sp. TaxID=239 RepID=UPI002ED7B934
MKKLSLYFSILFLFSFSSTLLAQTQAEMDQTAINDYKKADNELNLVYKKLMKQLSEKEKKLLIVAQKDWIKFRDSKCNFEQKEYEGGTIQPVIYYACLMECTNKRTEDLKANLEDREKRYGAK